LLQGVRWVIALVLRVQMWQIAAQSLTQWTISKGCRNNSEGTFVFAFFAVESGAPRDSLSWVERFRGVVLFVTRFVVRKLPVNLKILTCRKVCCIRIQDD